MENYDNHEETNLTDFDAVRSSMRLEQLPEFASEIRGRTRQLKGETWSEKDSCVVLSEILFGSFNIIFIIEFSDGIKWVLRVPATGHPARHDCVCADDIRSEALVMHLLKEKLALPIPHVYSFDDSLENPLNCPYILMEYIDGVRLETVWFDNKCPEEVLEARRARILEQLAAVMAALGTITFKEGGSLGFTEQNEPTIKPAVWEGLRAMVANLNTENSTDTPIYITRGPFKEAHEYFKALLAWSEIEGSTFVRGIYMFARLLVNWLPNDLQSTFVLCHMDFDLRNILVTPEGSLRAIIDWGSGDVVPCCVGDNYPRWLTRDWDLLTYEYARTEGTCFDSTEQLERYRAMYRQYLGKAILAISSDQNAHDTSLDQLTTTTRQSPIFEALVTAIAHPVFGPSAAEKLFQEIKAHALDNSARDKKEAEKRKSVLEDSQQAFALNYHEEGSVSNRKDSIENDMADSGEGGSQANKADSATDISDNIDEEGNSDDASDKDNDMDSLGGDPTDDESRCICSIENLNLYKIAVALDAGELDDHRRAFLEAGFKALFV